MLDVKNLKSVIQKHGKNYEKVLVNDVSFRVSSREVLGIFGESGSGKSSTALSILDILDVYPGVVKGEIWFEENHERRNILEGISDICNPDIAPIKKDIRKWNKKYQHEKNMKKIRGKKIALALQGARTALCPFHSVRTQIHEACLIGGNDEESATCITNHIIDMLQLTKDTHKYPHELSGGACQRAMLGIVIALNPNLLIADELTTGLDPILQLELIKIMHDFVMGDLQIGLEDKKHGMVIISHDLRVMRLLADNMIVMKNGGIVEYLNRDSFDNPKKEYTQKLFRDDDLDNIELGT